MFAKEDHGKRGKRQSFAQPSKFHFKLRKPFQLLGGSGFVHSRKECFTTFLRSLPPPEAVRVSFEFLGLSGENSCQNGHASRPVSLLNQMQGVVDGAHRN